MLDLRNLFAAVAGNPQKLASVLPFHADSLSADTLTLEHPAIGPGGVGTMPVATNATATAIDAGQSGAWRVNYTTGEGATAFALTPSAGVAGQLLFILVANASGGALTNKTFAAIVKAPSLTWPANGQTKVYSLLSDGTNWRLFALSADIPA